MPRRPVLWVLVADQRNRFQRQIPVHTDQHIAYLSHTCPTETSGCEDLKQIPPPRLIAVIRNANTSADNSLAPINAWRAAPIYRESRPLGRQRTRVRDSRSTEERVYVWHHSGIKGLRRILQAFTTNKCENILLIPPTTEITILNRPSHSAGQPPIVTISAGFFIPRNRHGVAAIFPVDTPNLQHGASVERIRSGNCTASTLEVYSRHHLTFRPYCGRCAPPSAARMDREGLIRALDSRLQANHLHFLP